MKETNEQREQRLLKKKEYRLKNREKIQKYRKAYYHQKQKTDPGYRAKENVYALNYYHTKSRPHQSARQALQKAVLYGHVKVSSKCEQCGGVGKLQGHHPDYSQPLKVIWLCTACHRDTHHKLIHRKYVLGN